MNREGALRKGWVGGVNLLVCGLPADDVSMAEWVAMAAESAGIRADDPRCVCHARVFLLLASRNPSENRSLIAFTAWSSLVHAAIMAVQAFQNPKRTWTPAGRYSCRCCRRCRADRARTSKAIGGTGDRDTCHGHS